MYLQFEEGFIAGLSAETVAHMFADFGDFYAYKDTESSCFFEFFMLDEQHVPERTVEQFIQVVKARTELHVVSGCVHQDAPRFKAHDRCDF